MQTLGNIFYALLFVSVIGSLFTIVSLFVNHVLHCALPLWFSLCGMFLFCVPFLSGDVFLISPEEQRWFGGFYMASLVWVCGCAVFLACDAARMLLARRGMKGLKVCESERMRDICCRCGEAIGVKKLPLLYWGSLDDPVCVAGMIRPTIIMNKTVAEQLTDAQLHAVFFHELTHIKRRHILWRRLYAYVCILNWFNPFSWIAKEEFALHCETDCDYHALKWSQGEISETEYAAAMIRVLELSSFQAAKPGRGMGALSFLLTKRRIKRITAKTSKNKDRVTALVLAAVLALTVMFSMEFSRQHFYPYPAYYKGTEWGAGYGR